jgi:hypothetical protein
VEELEACNHGLQQGSDRLRGELGAAAAAARSQEERLQKAYYELDVRSFCPCKPSLLSPLHLPQHDSRPACGCCMRAAHAGYDVKSATVFALTCVCAMRKLS